MNGRSGLLLDVPVLADIRSGKASPAVVGFLRNRSSLRIFISVLALGELPDPDLSWLRELTGRYACHILPVDHETALASARMDHGAGTLTALTASTAILHDLCVVTDRPQDYSVLGAAAVDPWADGR
ncbi:hypothetical protein OL239_15930 [Arthrobacter sp. ATA002]|uniref:hypothetical protein n=1 Tax=Arthrobacter sp. ATA002 TaxID=2991715 RepID=UPI0022A6827B|nr:hypothetical protein [Arthrobacter sp. ATA002]WAP51300.1 hypothetical protein OL239_15930 [Arthrobacter sp. ATA002]